VNKNYSWRDAVRNVLNLPKHKDLKVMKWFLTHPVKAGFKEAIGEPLGQKTDYRLTLPDGRSIHVREYDYYYLMHWDERDPTVDPVGHLVKDAPHWLVILGLIVLGILGGAYCWEYFYGKKKK